MTIQVMGIGNRYIQEDSNYQKLFNPGFWAGDSYQIWLY